MKFTRILVAITMILSFAWAHAEDTDSGRDLNTSSSDIGKVPVPTGKYITGGILASTVGFGIGHGVQGRYGDKGWIYTATEAGGLALMLAGVGTCKDEYIGATKNTTCSNGGLILIGAGLFI